MSSTAGKSALSLAYNIGGNLSSIKQRGVGDVHPGILPGNGGFSTQNQGRTLFSLFCLAFHEALLPDQLFPLK